MGWGGGVNNLLLSLMMHRNVLAVHYLIYKQPRTQLGVVSFGPLQNVCGNFLHTCQSGFSKCTVGMKKKMQTEHHTQRNFTWNSTTKKPDYQHAARFTTSKYCKYQYKTALSHFDWRFPMNLVIFSYKHEHVKTKKHKKTGKMNNSRIDRGINEECILYFNLNGRKSIVRQTWRCAEDRRCSKMCKLRQRKHNFIHFQPSTNMMFRRT